MNPSVNPLIIDQSFEFVIMLFAGMTIMLFHDIYIRIRSRLKSGKTMAFIQDILFWLFAAILTSSFLYYCSYGRLSIHALIAFGAGAILWKKFICGTIS
ncbi:MAG: spore cortex biosynthesis protein YabQ [Eubacteriales bacterium]|nr:spore cortex biosynthesis protein YabQ [Eubacteriales bacterium]MDD3199079.1 spore cortex biosynthesis protein YabQ [Eubacteriales bacterium]MDD4122112.1 spore cortex biosynthesis protein YabQ [Eubacteriales bacterium]MDD4629678.1 spore cortex biosynthesis protein YabQ [Eubacteriales bacterium]